MEPGSLGGRLRRLRDAAGLTQERMAADLHWVPSKVSKIENGHQSPTPGDIRDWTAVTRHPEETEDLLGLLDDMLAVRHQTRRRIRWGNAAVQEDMDQRTRAARRVREFEAMAIPGLLQTAGYAQAIAAQVEALYGTSDTDATVEAKLQRQAVLYQDRQFEFIITEAALRMPPCPVQVMLGQIDRLLALLDLDNVTLAVIPMHTELRFAPWYGFLMLDDAVISEDYLGRNEGSPVAAETCGQIFGLLMAEAISEPEDVRRLIMAVSADLRGR